MFKVSMENTIFLSLLKRFSVKFNMSIFYKIGRFSALKNGDTTYSPNKLFSIHLSASLDRFVLHLASLNRFVPYSTGIYRFVPYSTGIDRFVPYSTGLDRFVPY